MRDFWEWEGKIRLDAGWQPVSAMLLCLGTQCRCNGTLQWQGEGPAATSSFVAEVRVWDPVSQGPSATSQVVL